MINRLHRHSCCEYLDYFWDNSKTIMRKNGHKDAQGIDIWNMVYDVLMSGINATTSKLIIRSFK